MSLVDITTGEVVVMSESAARELVDSIRSTTEIVWRQIIRAYQGRAWVALGYESWDELCEQEFDGARIKLPREDRREVVASLADAGMSTRAIGAAIGVSQPTVSRDLSGDSNESPADDPDPASPHGIERATSELVDEVFEALTPANWDDAEIIDAEIVEAGPIDHRPITGLDGKSYTKPKPKPVDPGEQRRRDRDEAVSRHARQLERLISLWPYLDDLADHRDRDEVIARLSTDHDRLLLARIEARLTGTPVFPLTEES